MTVIPYDRFAAAAYANKLAFDRNPRYYNFDELGGDCTNFISQCLYAGCGVMNTTPTYGWYYRSLSSRSPSWSGVSFLYDFLMGNKGKGPFGEETGAETMKLGDVIQLAATDEYTHSLLVTDHIDGQIFVAAHTFDAYMRPLSSYDYQTIRYLHILGARK